MGPGGHFGSFTEPFFRWARGPLLYYGDRVGPEDMSSLSSTIILPWVGTWGGRGTGQARA